MNKSVGGIPFFLTYISLIIFLSFALRMIPRIIFNDPNLLIFYGSGILIGSFFSTFIVSYFSVLFHEIKHAIFSSLVGNLPKGMKIDRDSGYFQFSYYKETAGYNAMIYLAPYWLPIFSFLIIGINLIFNVPSDLRAISIGIAFGLDVSMGVRDIHNQQTDLLDITGGLSISISFVLMMNLLNLLITSLLAVKWISGFKDFVFLIYQFLVNN